MKVESETEVAQSCLTLSDPMDCSLQGSSFMGFSRPEYWIGVPLRSAFPSGSGGFAVKNPPANAREESPIAGSGRSSGRENGNPFQ